MITIDNESLTNVKLYRLYVNQSPQANVTVKEGVVVMTWEVRGPQYWPEAKLLLQGLLELSIIADQLQQGLEPL